MFDNKTIFQKPAVRLRVIRQALEIKQTTFAKYLKICPQTLRKWEQIGFSMKWKYRERLRYVGINSEWLDYGTGDPFQYELSVVREKIIFSVSH